jgi:hypothetical protein
MIAGRSPLASAPDKVIVFLLYFIRRSTGPLDILAIVPALSFERR